MSWKDCHVGYLPIAYAILAIAVLVPALSDIFPVGIVMQLNGLFALGYIAGGNRSSPALWWVAVTAAVTLNLLFLLLEFGSLIQGEQLSWGLAIGVSAISALAWMQFRFVWRTRPFPNPQSEY